ncbi:MAG: ATPase [Acidobacteria bacterium]|nr:ATPase [Acidobacteriota bacterium]
MWIGSALGLFRFDGVTFEQYVPPDGTKLPSYNIYSLLATPDGGLWISFRPSGLGFLKDGQLKLYTRPKEIPKKQVSCFARTPDGRIWAGSGSGLSLFNGAGWDDIGADWNFQSDSVRKMFTDRSGTLWICKGGKIFYLPPGSKTFQALENEISETDFHFAQAKDDRLWVSKNRETIYPENRPGPASSTKNPTIKTLAFEFLFDRDGSLWIAGGDEVKRIRYPEQLETETLTKNDSRIELFKEKDGLSSNTVGKVFEDREGNIWFVTVAGLDRFRYSPIVPVALDSPLKNLTLVAGSGGDVWAGSAMAINCYLRLRDGQPEMAMAAPADRYAASVYKADDGTLWWGTRGGILRQQNSDFKFYPQPKEMETDWMWEVIRAGSDGGLWVNFGDEGLIYFKDGVWERRKPPDGLPDRGPSASFEDERKRIWLGYTENRVYILDGERVRGFSSADGIEIGRIKVIRGRGGNFWFGGETGLAFFKDDRFYTVKADGKPFGAVSGIIAAANGDVWLNEIHGIVNIPADEIRRLNEDPEHPVKYRLFDFQDNLPGAPQMNYTVSTAVEATDGRLYFATDNGLAMIDPSRLEKNAFAPPVVVKSVIADEKPYQVAANTVFPAGTANLQINYTATSLSIPERVAFKYRLEGSEKEWHDAGNRREAFFTNLGPGKYRFRVIAANNDGVWNEQGAVLEFEVLPRFYQTDWFMLVFFAAVGVLGWIIYQWRVRQVKSRLHLLYEERLSERTRIAQDLHDTLLQGFLGTTMRLQAISNMLPEKPESAKDKLDDVLDQVDDVLEEGRRGIWNIRGSAVPDNDLERALTLVGEDLSTTYRADLTVTIGGENRPIDPLVRDDVYRIGREALTNAFRHSGATKIEVGVEYATRFLRISVRDNGRGIDPDFLDAGREGHMGLPGMRDFAEKIGAELKIWSRSEGGTEVELIVPHHIAYKRKSSGGLLNRLGSLFGRKKSLNSRTDTPEK